jgi:nickel/cobalt transporter (NicO) family protein
VGNISGVMQKAMKYISMFFILLIFLSIIPLANSNNPFTTKPKDQTDSFLSVIGSKIFTPIIVGQHKLKNAMSSLLREAEMTDSIRPLFLLIIAAFAYGVLHALGPGHGKAITLSYILSQRPSYIQGLLFGNFVAIFHGVSGILFVLIVKFILKASIIKNLETVTNAAQIVSYGIIACIGLGIFIHSIYKLTKKYDKIVHINDIEKTFKYGRPILLAFIIGIIPCPGVVTVVLFTLSMDMFVLGIILGISISIGMAITISIFVLITISGKTASLKAISANTNKAILIENIIELLAGFLLMSLGILFLGANLYTGRTIP